MRILLVGAASRGSGAGRVSRCIAEQLAPFHDVHQLGLGFMGVADTSLGWVVEHARDPRDWTGVRAAERWIAELAPDAVIVSGEIELCIAHARLMRCLDSRVVRIAYCSPAAPWRDATRLRALSGFDCVVAFADIAGRALGEAFNDLAQEDRPVVRVIPHGVDTMAFAPLPGEDTTSRASIKRSVFGDSDVSDDTVVFFNGNADWGCKQLGMTVRAFADFAQRGAAPDARLYIPGLSPESRRALGRSLGIEHQMLFAKGEYEYPIYSDAALNRLYNACDVGISTSCRETWGLSSLEHAATGAPQLVPGAWVTKEIWQDAAPLVEVDSLDDRTYELYSPREWQLRDRMRHLYESAPTRRQWGERARARALRADVSWSSIGRRFRELLEDIHGRK